MDERSRRKPPVAPVRLFGQGGGGRGVPSNLPPPPSLPIPKPKPSNNSSNYKMGGRLPGTSSDAALVSAMAATRRGPRRGKKEDLHAVPWDTYYDERLEVFAEDIGVRFRAYTAGMEHVEAATFVFVLVHGGGHTALSWALVAAQLKEKGYPVVAFDMRGHGETKCDDEKDLSLERLGADMVAFTKAFFANKDDDDAETPPIVLVGHSLGGAVVVNAATRMPPPLLRVSGLCVVDVVEGTALQALVHMDSILDLRPKAFASVEKAIAWSLRSNTVRNPTSAQVSVPPQVRFDESVNAYVWRTDLSATRPFWQGWYTGLSKHFLAVDASKLLVLAGADRLDTTLTIAQMQGKYQLSMIPESGHLVPEDAPEKLVEVLFHFGGRIRQLNKLNQAKAKK